MQATNAEKTFAPHPGSIVVKMLWNHTEKIEQATDVPETSRFIYYDAAGQETSDHSLATSRVPIVLVEISSFDADGNLADPKTAKRISINEFGPDHKFLRHISGR